jgi:CspA family cold shock protein
MPVGTVKFFNYGKGYGFIQPEDGSKDIFVHISAVEQSGIGQLVEGQKIKFDIEAERRGPKAVNLQAMS